MNLCKFDIKGRWQGFGANWRKRNWVTDVFLYGIQIAAVLYSFVMVAGIIDMICDFQEPYPLSCYEGMTIGGLIFRMLSKGWLGWSWSMYRRLFLQSESHQMET